MIDELDLIMLDIGGISSYQEVKDDLDKIMDKIANHMGLSKEDLESMVGEEVDI